MKKLGLVFFCFLLVSSFAIAEESGEPEGFSMGGEFSISTQLLKKSDGDTTVSTGLSGYSYTMISFNADYKGTGLELETYGLFGQPGAQYESGIPFMEFSNIKFYSTFWDGIVYAAAGIMEDDSMVPLTANNPQPMVGSKMGVSTGDSQAGIQLKIQPVKGLHIGAYMPAATYVDSDSDGAQDTWEGYDDVVNALKDIQYAVKFNNKILNKAFLASIGAGYQPSLKQVYGYIQPRIAMLPELSLTLAYGYDWNESPSLAFGSYIVPGKAKDHTIALAGSYSIGQNFLISADFSYTISPAATIAYTMGGFDLTMDLPMASIIDFQVKGEYDITDSFGAGLDVTFGYNSEGQAYYSDENLNDFSVTPSVILHPEYGASKTTVGFKYNFANKSWSLPVGFSISL